MVRAEAFHVRDLERFKNQLRRFEKFNALNENLYKRYEESSLFNKIQYRSGTRILWEGIDPLMILWTETRNYNAKLRCLIPLQKEEVVLNMPLEEMMPAFYEALPKHLDIHQFEYITTDEPFNEKVLQRMGFIYRRGLLRMARTLRDVPTNQKEVLLEKFHIDKIKDRVDLQNVIFDNKYRIPLSVTDVLMEISKKTYVPELSFFLVEEGLFIGYGQITKQPEGFFLVNFGIVPEYRNQGKSKGFLLEILRKAKEYGIDEVFLDVNEDNIRAKRLYEEMGFHQETNTCTWLYYVK